MRPDSFDAARRTRLKMADFSTYDPANEHSLMTVCVDRLQNGDVNVSFAVGDKFDNGEEVIPVPNASQNIAEAARSLYSGDLPFLAECAASDKRLCFVGDYTNENFAVVFVSPRKANELGKDMIEFAREKALAGSGLSVDNFGGTSLVSAVRKVYQETVLSQNAADADYWVGRMEELAGSMTVVEQANALDDHSAYSALKDHRSDPERLLRFDTYAADVVLQDGAEPNIVRSLSNVGLAISGIEVSNKVMRGVARTVTESVSGYVTVVAVVDNLTGHAATVVSEVGKHGGLLAPMAHATAYVTDWATLSTRQRSALGYAFEKDFDDHKFAAETLKPSAPVGRSTKEDSDELA